MASPLTPQAPSIPQAPMGLLSGAMRGQYLQDYNSQVARQFQMDDLNQAAMALQNQRQGMENDEFQQTQGTRLAEAGAKQAAAEEVLRMYNSGMMKEENNAKHDDTMGKMYSAEQLRRAEDRALALNDIWTTMQGSIDGEGGWMGSQETWAKVRADAEKSGIKLPEQWNPQTAKTMKAASDAAYQALPKIREKMLEADIRGQYLLGVQGTKNAGNLAVARTTAQARRDVEDVRRLMGQERNRTNLAINSNNISSRERIVAAQESGKDTRAAAHDATLVDIAELRLEGDQIRADAAEKAAERKVNAALDKMSPRQLATHLIRTNQDQTDSGKRQMRRVGELVVTDEFPKRAKNDPMLKDLTNRLEIAGLSTLDPNKMTEEQAQRYNEIASRIKARATEIKNEILQDFSGKILEDVTAAEKPAAPAASATPMSPEKAAWMQRAKARNPWIKPEDLEKEWIKKQGTQ